MSAAKAAELAYVLAGLAPRGAPEIAHWRADELKRAARLWVGAEAQKFKREQALAELSAALRSRDAGARVLAALGKAERQILAIVARFGGSISGRLLGREAVARGIVADPKPGSPDYYSHHDDPVQSLIHRLVLVPHRSSDYHYYSSSLSRTYPDVALASPLLPLVEPAAPLGWKPSKALAEPPATTYQRAVSEAALEISQVAELLARMGRWNTNRGGTPAKSERAKIAKALATADDAPLRPRDPALLHYWLLVAAGAVRVREGGAEFDAAQARRVFQRSGVEQAWNWVRGWLTANLWQDGSGVLAERDESSDLYDARERLAWALTRVAHGANGWLDLQTFLLDVRASADPHGYSMLGSADDWEPALDATQGRDALPAGDARLAAYWLASAGSWNATALLGTLAHLGLVERGFSGKGKSTRWAFRLTDLGRAVFGAPEIAAPVAHGGPRFFTVQPNHDVVAYLEHADPGDVARLAHVARRASAAGPVQTFRLTRESIYEALEAGMTRDQIETFLSSHGRAALPENVAGSLAEWSRKREALVVRTAVSVAAGDRATRDRLVARHDGRAVGEHFALLATAAARKLDAARGAGPAARGAARDWSADETGALTVGAGGDLIGRARLARFATPDRTGAERWRVTRESVAHARARGITPDQILAWLAQHLAHPTPLLLAAAIRNWSRPTPERAAVGDLTVLEIRDEAAYAAVRSSTRVRALLAGELPPRWLVVRSGSAASLRKVLAEAGFTVDGEVAPPPLSPPHAGGAEGSTEARGEVDAGRTHGAKRATKTRARQ